MSEMLRVGISTCPNDTFAFHALLKDKVSVEGLRVSFELLDVEELNLRLASGEFDIAKGSFHAALVHADRFIVLPSGSALGFGVGPVLLGAAGRGGLEISSREAVGRTGSRSRLRVLCPGRHTTAALLFRLFYPEVESIEHRVFSEIIPALESGNADYGVCIHEGRFTYREHGLDLVEDLGERWENETGAPLPLGGVFARKALGDERIGRFQRALRASLDYARSHPEEAFGTMESYAQEVDPDVIWKHVELYVNDWTLDLGEVGKAALAELSRRAKEAGVVAEESPELTIFSE